MFVADTFNHRIQVFSIESSTADKAEVGGGGHLISPLSVLPTTIGSPSSALLTARSFAHLALKVMRSRMVSSTGLAIIGDELVFLLDSTFIRNLFAAKKLSCSCVCVWFCRTPFRCILPISLPVISTFRADFDRPHLIDGHMPAIDFKT